MKLCFITYKYPGEHNTTEFVFVKQLVDSIAAMGHECHVLAPFNFIHYKHFAVSKEEYQVGKGKVWVYRPAYLSFSNLRVLGCNLSFWTHKKAVAKAFRMMGCIPDVIYGHFWSSAYEGFKIAKKYHIPLFVASGESDIKRLFSPKADQTEFCDYVSGVICVSNKNKEESIELGLTSSDKCRIIPNAVNNSLFTVMNKNECRDRLGFPQAVFIVIFVGWFNERKGSKRVAEAIKRIKGEPVYSIFIGNGEMTPDCANSLYVGELPHDLIPVYLNAADIFVLPTLQEGCCNAIVEAMSCGLPVISSDLSFNKDILNDNNSVLVDPCNIDEISRAIELLRDDLDKRNRLSEGAIEMSKELTIDQRAKSIMNFIING